MLLDSDSTWIEALLKNNDTPSEQAAREIGGLLLEPSRQLEEVDGEILILKNRLADLESRRKEIQQRIARYKTILAPIRRVPLDVLGEIFYHCLPTHRDPIVATSECPLLLTHVCSPWRNAALKTPKLWDRLYISFTDEDTVPDMETLTELTQKAASVPVHLHNAEPRSVKKRKTEVLRKRYDMVWEWLARSGTRTISLSLHLISVPWYPVAYSERPPSVTMEFLSFLASLAPRWERLELRSSPKIYKALENMLPISRMVALKSLRVEHLINFPEHGGPTLPLRLLQAPNLRQVSILGRANKAWGLPGDLSFTQWNKLTHITSFNAFSFAETISLLECSSNLIHYKGTIMLPSEGDTPGSLDESRIYLPFLQTLFIRECPPINFQARAITHSGFYDSIDAPELKQLTYMNQFSGSLNLHALSSVQIPILTLLRRSTQLEYLCVDGVYKTCDFRSMLSTVPSLTNLVIGREESSLAPFYIPALPPKHANLRPRRPVWDLEGLIVDQYHVLEDNAPLLPHLTSLLISSQSLYIADDALFELIRSRMVSSQTTPLKRMKGVLYREKEREIISELTCYAELVGAEMIDLDLMYAQSPSPSINPTSPEFGLMKGGEGPSWRYEDAGDLASNMWHNSTSNKTR